MTWVQVQNPCKVGAETWFLSSPLVSTHACPHAVLIQNVVSFPWGQTLTWSHSVAMAHGRRMLASNSSEDQLCLLVIYTDDHHLCLPPNTHSFKRKKCIFEKSVQKNYTANYCHIIFNISKLYISITVSFCKCVCLLLYHGEFILYQTLLRGCSTRTGWAYLILTTI